MGVQGSGQRTLRASWEPKGVSEKAFWSSGWRSGRPPKLCQRFQKHQKRNEYWLVTDGACKVMHSKNLPDEASELTLKKYDSLSILTEEWHQIINPYKAPCHIIEVQYGEETSEEDIERLFYYKK